MGRSGVSTRIYRAKKFLKHSEETIREIARMCGFADTFKLYKRFQSWVGCLRSSIANIISG